LADLLVELLLLLLVVLCQAYMGQLVKLLLLVELSQVIAGQLVKLAGKQYQPQQQQEGSPVAGAATCRHKVTTCLTHLRLLLRKSFRSSCGSLC
jgi:hypothetical protein